MKRLSVLSAAIVFGAAACSGSSVPPTGAPAAPATPPSASQSSASSPAAAGPVTITYLVGIAEDPEIDKQAEAMIQEFNDTHPNIQVKREALENDQLRTIIQTRLGSGDVDVFGYDTGPGFGGVLAKAGLVADMGPAYEKYGWGTFDWAKSRCTYSGVLSCMPGQVEELGIYYNKKMFARQGLQRARDPRGPHARSMDAFKADGITPLAFGDQPQWPAGHQWSMTLSNLVGREGMDARLYGDAKWNDAPSVKAIDIFFKQFNGRRVLPEGPERSHLRGRERAVLRRQGRDDPHGHVARVGDHGQHEGLFRCRVLPVPCHRRQQDLAARGARRRHLRRRRTPSIPDESMEFIDWMISDAVVKKWLLPVFNQIPAQPVDTTGVEVSPLFQIVLDDLAQSSGSSSEFGYNIDVMTPAGFNDQMFTGFQEVLSGKLTPQEQADKLQAEYEKAMAAGETIPKP